MAVPFNDRWLLILEVVRQVNEQRYALDVDRIIFQKICYVLTRSGIQTGFTFTRGELQPIFCGGQEQHYGFVQCQSDGRNAAQRTEYGGNARNAEFRI